MLHPSLLWGSMLPATTWGMKAMWRKGWSLAHRSSILETRAAAASTTTLPTSIHKRMNIRAFNNCLHRGKRCSWWMRFLCRSLWFRWITGRTSRKVLPAKVTRWSPATSTSKCILEAHTDNRAINSMRLDLVIRFQKPVMVSELIQFRIKILVPAPKSRSSIQILSLNTKPNMW